MCYCWLARPSSRPTFAELHVIFDQYMSRHLSEQYPYIDVDGSTPYQFDHLAPRPLSMGEDTNNGILNIDEEEDCQISRSSSSGYESGGNRETNVSNGIAYDRLDASHNPTLGSASVSPDPQLTNDLEVGISANSNLNLSSHKISHQSLRRLRLQQQSDSEFSEMSSRLTHDGPYSQLRVTSDVSHLAMAHVVNNDCTHEPQMPQQFGSELGSGLEHLPPPPLPPLEPLPLQVHMQMQLPSVHTLPPEDAYDQLGYKKLSTITEDSFEDYADQHETGIIEKESSF